MIRIPSRLNGPPGSANGGVTCGLLAQALGASPAEVSLRVPPPLETDMQVTVEGDEATLLDGDTVVATARRAEPEVPHVEAVSYEQAERAVREGYEGWASAHPFPTCVVCGPQRGPGDGMRIFPAAVGDGRFVSTWEPGEACADAGAAVPTEHVWAALDCPTSAPLANWGQGPPIVLARLAASVEAPVPAGGKHVLVSWELGREGRKREAACVLFDSAGGALARARALWVELRAPAA